MDVQAQDSELHEAATGRVVPASARTRAITFHDPVYSDTAPTPVVAYRPRGAAGRTAPGAFCSVPRSSSWSLPSRRRGRPRPGEGRRHRRSRAVPARATASGDTEHGGSQGPTGGPDRLRCADGQLHRGRSRLPSDHRDRSRTGVGERGLIGQHPVFAGVLSPNTSKGFAILGSSSAEVGAGGTTLTLTAGQRTSTLVPPPLRSPTSWPLSIRPLTPERTLPCAKAGSDGLLSGLGGGGAGSVTGRAAIAKWPSKAPNGPCWPGQRSAAAIGAHAPKHRCHPAAVKSAMLEEPRGSCGGNAEIRATARWRAA